MSSDEAIPGCVACGRSLRRLWEEDPSNPAGGLSFHSHGHYGSTMFDPVEPLLLQINVCDECIKSAMERNDVLLVRASVSRTLKHLGIWDGTYA